MNEMFVRQLKKADKDAEIVAFDVFSKDRKLPTYDEIQQIEAFLITGSPADSFAQDQWILDLKDLIVRLRNLKKALVGICFGHQIIAEALGGKVQRAEDVGYQIGVKTYSLVPSHPLIPLLDLPSPLPFFSISAAHFDQVVRLPQGAEILVVAEKCPVAAYTIGHHTICFQNHPEFLSTFLRDMIVAERQDTPVHLFEEAVKSCDIVTEGELEFEWIVRFVQRYLQEHE
eukprot:c8213_g1_i1.p1 GENE.c8213_g1_i1~~c8213_g1_i1.p1  ORF type:complete len:259 (+),score=64.30 c8213_g1_i1:91-777(+)